MELNIYIENKNTLKYLLLSVYEVSRPYLVMYPKTKKQIIPTKERNQFENVTGYQQ